MKNLLRIIFPFIIILFSCFLITSCTREYTCQCTISYSGQPGLPDPEMHEYKVKDTKKNAEAKCEGNSETSEINGIKTVEDCKLW